MRLTNVRIPRTWLLMKNQQVTEDGEYKTRSSKNNGSAKSNLQYLTMLSIRASLVAGAGYRLAQGVTIATRCLVSYLLAVIDGCIRYSCVRHQGFADTTKAQDRMAPERAVMDYQTQQYRLLKQLSLAYAFCFTGKSILHQMAALQEELEQEEGPSASHIAELHAVSSGLKALCTFEGAAGLEECRKCCGGHGVLMMSGVAQMALDYVTYNTAEGDRIVLELQSARSVTPSARHLMSLLGISSRCFGSLRRGNL